MNNVREKMILIKTILVSSTYEPSISYLIEVVDTILFDLEDIDGIRLFCIDVSSLLLDNHIPKELRRDLGLILEILGDIE